MSIHKIGSDLIRPTGTKAPRGTPVSPEHSDTEELRRVERVDRVDISPEGRELAARWAEEGEGLTETRKHELDHRLGMRFYNEPSVAARVAERMLASGDLGFTPGNTP